MAFAEYIVVSVVPTASYLVCPAAAFAVATVPSAAASAVSRFVAASCKTTLLNAIAATLPADDRIVIIEDTAELHLPHANQVRFEARREQRDLPAVTIRALLKAALRHRPDRIVVGEVRGGEAYDLLEALNTGHAGSLSTSHANSAAQALHRFASCVVQSGVDVPYEILREQITACVQLVIHLSRRDGRRRVVEILRTEPAL